MIEDIWVDLFISKPTYEWHRFVFEYTSSHYFYSLCFTVDRMAVRNCRQILSKSPRQLEYISFPKGCLWRYVIQYIFQRPFLRLLLKEEKVDLRVSKISSLVLVEIVKLTRVLHVYSLILLIFMAKTINKYHLFVVHNSNI